jgi:polyhydroxyalkanoate synthase
MEDRYQEAVEARLGIEEAVMDVADPVGLGRSLVTGLLGAFAHPLRLTLASAKYAAAMASVATNTTERLLGGTPADTRGPDVKDKRFGDTTWRENAIFHGLMLTYLRSSDLLMDVLEIADLPEPANSKARFAGKLLADAVAPTNFLLTNPAALTRAFQTGGRSALRGASTMLDDIRNNGGWPKQVDTTPFQLGQNMAATPGKVVYRNELIELIQYEARTDQVREVPLLMCPPWINKYYIMDLAPGKSLAEWAVQQGLTTFAISYRNPDASMSDVTFDDYLVDGQLAALDVVREITGAPQVNTLAVCLGGTLNACTLAYLNATGDDVVKTSTYLNSLVDFTNGGALKAVFTDASTVDALVRKMEEKGYLDGAEMAHTFDLLRANDLVFNYVASNWLMGEKPPPFDLLTWNNDSTRMPAKMHAFYLRRFYIENALAKDELTLAGEKLMASGITQPTYIVSAVDDHIVPWQASYRTTQLLKGDVRFVLSSAGHIAGIVNPPSPKARLWTNDALPADPARWMAGATEHHDTWWSDWAQWIVQHSGELRDVPALGDSHHIPLCDAPGTYVFT